jgi:hypothetical protein
VSRGECFACVASLPAPSPCERLSRLGLLWAGLTPVTSPPRLLDVDRGEPHGGGSPPTGNGSGSPEFKVPLSSERSSIRFSAHMPRSCDDPDGTFNARHGASSGTGFSPAPGRGLLDLLPHPNNYGAVSTFRRLRDALWPACFPVYASSKPFRHPFCRSGSRGFVGNAVPSATFNDLADFNATLGSDYWLGVITSGLSPDKKRLALLGAQRRSPLTPARGRGFDCGLKVE